MVENRYKLTMLLVVFLLLTGCAGWSRTEKALLAVSILAASADAYTTCRMLDNPDNWEVNPVLGDHASDEAVISYMVFTEAVTVLLAHFVPALRPYLLGGKALANTAGALNNKTLEW